MVGSGSVKLLLDANLSPDVGRRLKEAGHDATHVADIGLLTATDPAILRAAAKEKRILLTADSDFGALLALGSLASPSVLLLRSDDHLRPAEQAELIAANLPQIADDLQKAGLGDRLDRAMQSFGGYKRLVGIESPPSQSSATLSR